MCNWFPIAAPCSMFSHFYIHQSHDCSLHLRRMILHQVTLIFLLCPHGRSRGSIRMGRIDCRIRGLVTEERGGKTAIQ